jgi:hypothetical protein
MQSEKIITLKQNIKLFNIYGSDLFSRAKANDLLAFIDQNADELVLDFSEINFMSRSFTDELFNIIDALGKTVHYKNCNNDIQAMLRIVSDGRAHERNLGITHPKMYKFSNKSELVDFLEAQ